MQVRLQRPTISAEMSFLLAVMKFYVPDFAIASVTPIPFQTQDVLLTGQHPFLPPAPHQQDSSPALSFPCTNTCGQSLSFQQCILYRE